MNSLLDIVTGSSLTWLTLLFDASIKGSAILVLAIVAVIVLRRSPSSLKHLLWCAGLAGFALLLPLSLFLPSWQPSFYPEFLSMAYVRSADGKLESRLQAGWLGRLPFAFWGKAASDAGAASHGPVREDLVSGTEKPLMENNPLRSFWPLALSVVWAGGFVAVLVRQWRGFKAVREIDRGCQTVTDPAWKLSLETLSRALGLRRTVVLKTGAAIRIPMTWGVRRPVISIPEAAGHWSAGRREAVLLHELAHIRRHDFLTHSLARLVCALYWFHPLVWRAARELRIQSEGACDDEVLRSGSPASEYAKHLVDIARSLGQANFSPGMGLALVERPFLERRVAAILDRARKRDGCSRRLGALVGGGALCAVVGLAAMRPVSGSNEGAQAASPQLSVEELMRRSLEAQGGAAALDRVRSLKIIGKMVTPPVHVDGSAPPQVPEMPAFPVTFYVKHPDRVRMDGFVGERTMTEVYDPALPDGPGMGAMINSVLKQVLELTRSLAGVAPSGKLELLGKEQIDNREVYRLRHRETNGDVTYLFVDSLQFTRTKRSGLYGGVDFEIHFNEHKKIDGVLIPHVIEYKAYGGQTFSKITIDKAEINFPLDDSFFTKPPADRR